MNDNTLERDEWLMGQVAAGRADRMEPLLRRYGTPLLTFIRRMIGGDSHRGEELFQETFLAIWAKRHQYRFPMPFKPWLYRIAVNKCRAAFRVKGLGRVRSLTSEIDAGHFHSATCADTDPSPAQAAIAIETAALLETVVASLPPKQRLVVVLRIWNDLSYTEVAEILNVCEATVRSNMHDALAAIRRQLENRL
jgi:RNA polymerase sigma-70 factor (ECF subfamily)